MQILVLIIIALISSILQGITGFGFALIACPLCLIFFSQPTVVVILTIISLVLNFFLLSKIKAEVDQKLIKVMILAGLVGVPLGVIALTLINPAIMKLSVAGLSLIFGLVMLFVKIKLKQNHWLTAFIGTLTGFLQSSVGMSGPPVALTLTGYGLETVSMRRTLAIFFLALNAFSLPLFLLKNILTWDRFLLALATIPVVIIGGQIGNRFAGILPKEFFRILTIVLVLGLSVQMILKTLGN